ncbi:MAG: phospho-sugar mutase [Flavobacteriaceae bacterium]|nr:phospho-sugar mutase [Flavobacteriaceae bacterium]
MSINFADRAAEWKKPPFDLKTQQEVSLLSTEPKVLEDAFYKDLEFGTGGMRGVMGVGTNRVNKYTFGRNTQGLSQYLKQQFPEKSIRVVIGYDCRHQSDTLAKIVADIFSANDIEVFLFSSLRATPEVSFAVRHLNAQCGVVLTASHNPPEYNGYKVYWQDGGQIVPPHDKGIIETINKVGFDQIQFEPKNEKIQLIDKEIDKAFQQASAGQGKIGSGDRTQLSVVFTALHGTSITAIPQVLEQAGYTQVHIVDEQAKPDGDFPTVSSPNPEEPEALKMALELAEKLNADIVIGTDPDADRLGIAVRNQKGKMELLNGNQTMVVMTKFILEQFKKEANTDYFIGSTVVSTPMMSKLADAYGVDCKLGLTGFKWIAKMIEDFPGQKCLGGGEESFGFMVGDFVRDKDAVTSALLACEIAATEKSKGSSFFDALLRSYEQLGFYQEKLVSFTKKGKEGAQEIQQMMRDLRKKPPVELDGSPVVIIEDYLNSTLENKKNQTTSELNFPKSDVIILEAEDGTRVAARPSGTEPKIKFYFSVQQNTFSAVEYEKSQQHSMDRINRIAQALGINT